MNSGHETAHQALKRLLANGPIAALPTRLADQELLVTLAAAQIDAGKDLLERDVNERLRTWLETFSEPFGIDHVTLRRMLVDSGILTRTTSGSLYRINVAKLGKVEAVRDLNPAGVLARVREDRDSRKRLRAA